MVSGINYMYDFDIEIRNNKFYFFMKTLIKKNYACRNEELPTIGLFIFNSLKRDAAAFCPYTDFDPAFAGGFEAGLTTINALLNPAGFTSELVKVTFKMYTEMNALRGMLDPLQNYVVNAGDTLTVLPEDFGFQAVRNAIRRRDVEQLDGSLKILEQAIGNNFTALKAKGYTAAMQTALLKAHKDIMDANAEQNLRLDEREELVFDNQTVLNDFYTAYVSKTANQGKRIYRTTQPSRVNDYTIAALIRRMRQEQYKTSVSGVVRDSSGNILAKTRLEFKPVSAGSSKKTATDSQGAYKASGMKAGDYNLFVVNGATSKVMSVHLESGDNVVDVVL